MYKWLFAVILPVLLGAGPPAAPDEEYQALERAFNEAQQKYQEARRQQPEGQASERLTPPAKEFVPRFRAYAEKHLGQPAALPALAWLLRYGLTRQDNGVVPADVKWALAQVTKDYAAYPEMADIMPKLHPWDLSRQALINLYQKVIAINKDKQALAAATFLLAHQYYDHPDVAPDQAATGSAGKAGAGASAKQQREAAKRVAQEQKRAKELFAEVIRDYPDSPYAKSAAGYIFEIEHLQIGMTAPEFAGADADGKEIRLSGLRGRVVVLDFWGFW